MTDIPYSKDAEEALLGSLLINPDGFNDIRGIINADDFYIHRNRWVYEAIVTLIEKRSGVDTITLCEELESKGKLAEIGSVYVTQLLNSPPSSQHVEDYAKVVKDNSCRRHILVTANELANIAYAEQEDFAERAEISIAEMRKSFVNGGDTKTAIEIGLEFAEKLYEKPDVIRLGLGALDNATGGIDKQTLTILAAATSVGKSTVALQIARNVVAQGKTVVFFALEQARKMLWTKMACGDMKYDYRKIKLGLATDDELRRIGLKSADLMAKYKDMLMINDHSGLTSQQIWSVVARYKPDLFIVDHLGLVSDPDPNLIQRLGNVSMVGKSIAKELNSCALYLCQINRGVTGRDNKRPTLADLRDSGHLENNADIVMFLYRDDYYNNRNKPITEYQEMEIDIAKNRDGVSGVRAVFDYLPVSQWLYSKGENV